MLIRWCYFTAFRSVVWKQSLPCFTLHCMLSVEARSSRMLSLVHTMCRLLQISSGIYQIQECGAVLVPVSSCADELFLYGYRTCWATTPSSNLWLHNYAKRMAIFSQCHLPSRKAFDFLVSVLCLPVGKIKTVRSSGYHDGSITDQ